MKINFQDLNLAPMPNPKPLRIQRVRVSTKPDGNNADSIHGQEYGVIQNSALDPAALTERW